MDFDIWHWNQSVWFGHLEWILNWKSFTLTEIRDIDSMSVLLVKRLSKSQCRGPTRNRFFFLSLCPFSRYLLFFSLVYCGVFCGKRWTLQLSPCRLECSELQSCLHMKVNASYGFNLITLSNKLCAEEGKKHANRVF